MTIDTDSSTKEIPTEANSPTASHFIPLLPNNFMESGKKFFGKRIFILQEFL